MCLFRGVKVCFAVHFLVIVSFVTGDVLLNGSCLWGSAMIVPLGDASHPKSLFSLTLRR